MKVHKNAVLSSLYKNCKDKLFNVTTREKTESEDSLQREKFFCGKIACENLAKQ